MTEKRTRMVACPACDGERVHPIGGWFMDKETGARSPYTVPCARCEGTGGVEVELEPITLDDLEAMAALSPDSPR